MNPAISFSAYLLTLPVQFIRWWFFEATFSLLKIMLFLLSGVFHLLGIASIFKTFFKPWKNEYREGLVRFAIFMGMFLKIMILIIGVLFLFGFIILEFLFLFAWVLFPLIVIWGLYAAIFS